MPRRLPAIAVVHDTANDYGRGIVEGILRYEQSHGPWRLQLFNLGSEDELRVPAGWKGDGVIAAVRTSTIARNLLEWRLPIVNVSGCHVPNISLPVVRNDVEASIQLAIEHLRERGFKNVAFCSEPRRFLSHLPKSFSRVMEGIDAASFIFKHSSHVYHRSGFDIQQQDRTSWIKNLPKPVGILGWDVKVSRYIVEACETVGIKVPEEVAVISLEYEKFLGEIVRPPISGVIVALERIGFEAAALLDGLMRGDAPNLEPVIIPPLGVEMRQSTDVLAVADVEVREALSYIRQCACDGIMVADVLDQVPLSRRDLERRFKTLLGRSPAAEIRRIRLDRAKELLARSDLPVSKVAEAVGFDYVERFVPLFRKHVGITPLAYRKQVSPR